MADAPISVLIVDDHGLVREGLRAMLEAEAEFEVVAEAKTGAEAVALARHHVPDVVVLDLRLPDTTGAEACAELRVVAPDAKVLICSGLDDGTALLEAARAGADGFVSKEAPNREVVDSVRKVAAGAAIVGTTSATSEFRRLGTSTTDTAKLAQLSARERQILGLLAEGLTNHEIAERVYVSEKTVRNNVSAMLRKLHVRHRTEAALYAASVRSALDD